MAAWEGAGEIDYGEESDELAFKYRRMILSNYSRTMVLRSTDVGLKQLKKCR